MKKLLSVMLSVLIFTGAFTALPMNASAASRKVKLKKSSATLKITKKNGKNSFGKITIKLKKSKGVTVKKKSFKSSNAKIAKVSNKGVVTAKKKGSANIYVKVKYTFKKRTYSKKLTFKVKVKDLRVNKSPVEPEIEPEAPSMPADFIKKLSAFSNKLYNMSVAEADGNFVMSPVSVYMALSMLYSVGDDNVKNGIIELVGMDDGDFKKTGELYLSLVKEYKAYDWEKRSEVVTGRLSLSNSVWLDDTVEADKDTLGKLADDYFCQAYNAPFQKDNSTANQLVREFVKKQTNGLIDKDFGIGDETMFALINTLYFKDIWSSEKGELATKKDSFKTSSGDKTCEYLLGKYVQGQVQETDCAQYFYTTTERGYKIKLILPKDSCTLAQAMSAESLDKINGATEFNRTDSKGTRHFTRCIFPSFKIESDTPLTKIFKDNNCLTHAFYSFLSPLTPEDELCVSDIIHKTVLDVNKKGVEGAAVTIIAVEKASAIATSTKYHDFVLNKGFGFIVTDKDDTILFEGRVTDPT